MTQPSTDESSHRSTVSRAQPTLKKNIQISKDDYYDALSQISKGWMESENDDTPFIKCILGVGWLYRDFEDCVDMVGTKMRKEKCLKKQ